MRFDNTAIFSSDADDDDDNTTVGRRADLIKWKTLEEIVFKRISHQFVCHSVSIDTLNQISQQLVSMSDSSNHLLQNTFPLPCG